MRRPPGRGASYPSDVSDYRRPALQCPTCNAILEEQTRGDARIELCNGCGGLYIDWHDGEVPAVVRKVGSLPAGSTLSGGGSGACPHCSIALHAEAFDGTDATVLRCGSCAGVFVPRSAFDALRRHARGQRVERPPAEPLLTSILDALERLITPGGG